MVTDELIEEFKEVMRITHDDRRIKGTLERAIAYVKSRCGEFDLDSPSVVSALAKDLVLNRARYDYYESTDLFEDNYLSDLVHLALLIASDDYEDT
mgnify:CR=1 FL=1